MGGRQHKKHKKTKSDKRAVNIPKEQLATEETRCEPESTKENIVNWEYKPPDSRIAAWGVFFAAVAAAIYLFQLLELKQSVDNANLNFVIEQRPWVYVPTGSETFNFPDEGQHPVEHLFLINAVRTLRTPDL